jgi:hypothetical protein
MENTSNTGLSALLSLLSFSDFIMYKAGLTLNDIQSPILWSKITKFNWVFEDCYLQKLCCCLFVFQNVITFK